MSVPPQINCVSETDSDRAVALARSCDATYGCNDSESISAMSTFESGLSNSEMESNCTSEETDTTSISHAIDIVSSSSSRQSTSGAHSKMFFSQFSSDPSFVESSISGLGSLNSCTARDYNISDVDIFAWLDRGEVASLSTTECDDDFARNDDGLDSDDTSLDSDDEMAVENMQIK